MSKIPSVRFFRVKEGMEGQFNSACLPHMKDLDSVRFKITPDLLLIEPGIGSGSVKIRRYPHNLRFSSANLRNLGLDGHTYQLYRSGKYFYIKRYQPLDKSS